MSEQRPPLPPFTFETAVEKGPLYPKCISPDLSAILIQKDDAEAQGIRANPRQKNWATWQGQR